MLTDWSDVCAATVLITGLQKWLQDDELNNEAERLYFDDM